MSSLYRSCNFSATLKLFYVKVLKTITGLSCLLQSRIEPSASCPERVRRPSHSLLPETTRQLVKMPDWLWETGSAGEKGRKCGESHALPGSPPEVKSSLDTKKGTQAEPSNVTESQVWGGQDRWNRQHRGGRRREKQVTSSRNLHRVPWVPG